MAESEMFLIFSGIILLITIVIILIIIAVIFIKVLNILNKKYKWNLENNKRKQDIEAIRYEEIKELLKEIKEELKNNK